jgi:hypothetical protein
MSTTANNAANTATQAANIAVRAANTAQIAASQAAVSASQGSNITNITVINPNAAGLPGSLQFSSTSNQLSASTNLIFDQNTANLQLNGNLRVQNAIEVETLQLKSAIANGNIQAERIIAARIESLANLQVANRVTANVVSANTFVGDGSNLTGILKQNNPTLTGNVTIPNISISGPLFAPVPLQLLVDQLALKANINSPNFTGNPTAPTLTNVSSSSNSIATTAFVQLVANTKANLSNVTLRNVSLVGNVFAPTQLANVSNTTVATTKFVQDQKINLNLSGIPTAPIPNANAVANQIATVSFVRSTGAPCVILSRRGGTTLNWNPGVWQNIPFDTFDRNTIGAAIDGTGFDLPAGTYVYEVNVRVVPNGTPTESYMRLQNVDTNFTIQNISSGRYQGIGQFTLSGLTTCAIQVNGSITGVIAPSFSVPIGQGYQQAYIQLFKVA